MMSKDKILELIRLKTLAKQNQMDKNVKAIRNIRKEIAKEKIKG